MHITLKKQVICMSGGRSSAYMLYRILQKYDGKLPKNTIVIFNNTGKERPETLDFVNEISERWAVPITWLEYDIDKNGKGTRNSPFKIHKVVDYKTASRNGEPFEKLIFGRLKTTIPYLPSRTTRVCSKELKVETARRYMERELGYKKWNNHVGIRADEKVRADRLITVGYFCPLYEDGITKKDVAYFWDNNDFDLKISSALSNCDACFFKPLKTMFHTFRTQPHLADWWIDMEKRVSAARPNTKKENNQFREGHSMQELLDMAMKTPELPMNFTDEELEYTGGCLVCRD